MPPSEVNSGSGDSAGLPLAFLKYLQQQFSLPADRAFAAHLMI
jgi:hypothetical protein